MPPTPTTFELMYHKCKNISLFETLEGANTGLHNLQNYIPIYRRFFSLSDTNHNNINLNHRFHASSVQIGGNKNNVSAVFESDDKKRVFIKYSPLLDPIKYLSGKYDMTASDLLVLPYYAQMSEVDSVHQKKMHDVNNSSYVDAFFTYLTSRALHEHEFLHGLDFYGSHLANQDEFTVNIYDELDHFGTCDFFLKNRNELFRLDETPGDYFESASARINVGEDLDVEALELNALDNYASDLFVDTQDRATDNDVSELEEFTDEPNAEPNAEQCSQCSQSSDSCSSRSSDDDDIGASNSEKHDNSECDDSECDNSECDNSECDDSECDDSEYDDSEYDDEVHNAHIFNFPVHAIMMEKCDNTLDSLMCGKNELTDAEWTATLLQVVMALIAYQHMFAFTHNDLHTNNIMFVKTDKKFLHYLYNGVYYRVPTHGRIMKIIDFGRAVYKYRGQTMCSDSFDRGGDAATQYNCEPYMNPKKPRLEPNPSFDLCRLACSLFDYFVEDIRDEAECAAKSRVASVVTEWLKDDKGRNVLYKKNGDERYPEFKLYKMIARTVHGAVPHEQLKRPAFAHYAIQRKHINGKPHIMNIDALPSYIQQAQTQSN